MKADIVIVGGGLAGMTAAYEATKQGLRPVVIETRGRPGGLIASAKLGGVPFDIGAESWATRNPVVGDLVDELGLEVTEPTGRSWIWNENLGKAYPIPEGTLGLPADIDAPEVREAIGDEGVARAKEDLTMDPALGADAKDLATFIETRVGSAVLDHLVRPVAGGIHTSDPSVLAVDTVTPGLRAAMKETGSLLKGAALLAQRNPGAKVAQTRGGMFRLIEALETEVVAKGGKMATRHAVVDFKRTDNGWSVDIQPTVRGADPAADPVPEGPVQTLETKRLVIALPGPNAMPMLDKRLDIPAWELPLGAPIAHQVLMIDSHALDDGPRGSGLLVSIPEGEPKVRAKALSHLSYKWGWMSEVLSPGRHILRVSYGRPGEPYPEPTLASALQDVNTLLGTQLVEDDVVAHMLVRWDGQLAPQTPKHRENVAKLLQALERYEGLKVTGAWIAGSGFAAVVPHARQAVRDLA
ncbi:MAG: FAD-dependent oxidoreductase [Actinomycetaceae bacterium]|nr:FAD-dependent oxidoreductase [Actinomycetaceae bacterium]